MGKASIPVNLVNPGQVFACIGFLEAADELLGEARGGFDWSDEEDVQFQLVAKGDGDPIQYVLEFLARSSVRSRAPLGSELGTEKWNVLTVPLQVDDPFPMPLPVSPATLPTVLECSETGQSLVVDHWGDNRRVTSRDNVKFWAGAGGYPGAALARDGIDLVRERCSQVESNPLSDPLNLSVEQSSSFRFDWRRDYIPLDIGFSLNSHSGNRFTTVGYPLVEILAAIGLTHARPEFISKLTYRYGVLGVTSESDLYDPCVLRAALGAPRLPFQQRTFRMNLGWPGKEGQARCITTVYEESDHE